MPNAIAMTSEFNPRRRRATMVMIMFCGFSVGAALGGLLAAVDPAVWLVARYSSSAASRLLLLVPILALRLPESVRFPRAHRGAQMNASRNCSDSSARRPRFAPANAVRHS